MTPPTPDPLQPIMAAAQGLLYPSETDSPLDPVRWPASTPLDAVLSQIAGDRSIEETPVNAFFAELEQSDEGDRWKSLHQTLERQLDDLRIFRIGNRKIDIYIIGRTRPPTGWWTRLTRKPPPAWAGIHTTSIET